MAAWTKEAVEMEGSGCIQEFHSFVHSFHSYLLSTVLNKYIYWAAEIFNSKMAPTHMKLIV